MRARVSQGAKKKLFLSLNSISNRSSFLMSLRVRFFDGYAVNIVVGAERNDFQIGRYVMYHASTYTVDVEVVGIHERHATQEEDFASDFAQGLI